MTGPEPRAAVAVAALVVAAVVAGAVALGAPATVAGASGQADGGEAGAVVAATVAEQGDDLGTPVAAPAGRFDRSFYARVSRFAAAYNERQPDLGLGEQLATGNVVNLRVTAGDDEAVVSFRLTEDNRIEDLRAGARGDAKITLRTDAATFDRVATAESPGVAFRRALDDGGLRVRGRGAGSGVVWRLVNLLRGL